MNPQLTKIAAAQCRPHGVSSDARLNGTITNQVVKCIAMYAARTVSFERLLTPAMARARNAATAPRQPTDEVT